MSAQNLEEMSKPERTAHDQCLGGAVVHHCVHEASLRESVRTA